MNKIHPSQVKDLHLWKRWYASGAVPQPTFPEGSLIIDAIGTHYAGPGEGHQTLSLGRARTSPHSYSPICWVVVPTSKKHKLGVVLERLPGNAAPVEVFFHQ